MTNVNEALDEEYADFDDYEEEVEEENGLSGFSVLMIGLVMFGAFAAITWIFYQQGIKRGAATAQLEAPYIAPEPEPIKIENADDNAAAAAGDNREVYDVIDGDGDPQPATVIAEGPEEPVNRGGVDTIAEIAAAAGPAEIAAAETNDRVEALRQEDADALAQAPQVSAETPQPQGEPVVAPSPPSSGVSAISGSHVVQVGAFRSDAEARNQWDRITNKLGASVVGNKSIDIESADLGARGVYHRLRVGPFANADLAKRYCDGLKANGQDCLVKKL